MWFHAEDLFVSLEFSLSSGFSPGEKKEPFPWSEFDRKPDSI